jgi:hypothetical protein
VDILNLDAYCYLENLALYPLELRGFLDRGGVIAWGIVPNTEEVYCEPPEELALWLRQGIEIICNKASARDVEINPEEFFHRSLLTTSCGLGSATVSIADYTLDVLVKVGEILRVETQKPD